MFKSGVNAKDLSIPISTFPESLHPLLKEIDGPDGNGSLETDELTEVFELYAAAKKANEEGCIALKSLPKELQGTLQVFDVDGDGIVGTAELARAAELYEDSKNMVKRLVKAVAVLFLVMAALVGTIVGLTAHVIESSKETETGGDGITFVKGSDQPAASATVFNSFLLEESFSSSANLLELTKSLSLQSIDETEEFSYTITGWYRNQTILNFYAARGDVISVDAFGNIIVYDQNGEEVLNLPAKDDEVGRRRKLLRRGRRGFHLTTNAGSIMTAGNAEGNG